MVMGIGRGDSARRYIGQKPVPVGRFEEALRMIKPFMNGEKVHVERHRDRARAGCARSCRRSRCTSPATARRCSAIAGPPRRRRDHPARRPGHHPVDDGHGPQGGRGGGPRPGGAQVHRLRAEPHLATTSPHARDQVRWFPAMVSNHVKDLIARYGADGSVVPQGADRLRAGRDRLRLRRALARGRQARRVRERRDLRPLLRARHARAGDREARGARVDRRRPVQRLPDDRGPGGDARDLRPGDHPALRSTEVQHEKAHPRRHGRVRHRRVGRRRARSTARRSSPSATLGDVDAEVVDADRLLRAARA